MYPERNHALSVIRISAVEKGAGHCPLGEISSEDLEHRDTGA
jgi:hypothetical protein